MINFYHENNPSKAVFSISVDPHLPGETCASENGLLMFIDKSKNPREIRWLDCKGSVPTPLKAISTQQSHVCEMCYAESGGKGLLVCSTGREIKAYNSCSAKLEWCFKSEMAGMQAEINPKGLATTNEGRLFVSDDIHAFIQVFTADGRYLGCLIKEGEQGLGKPLQIRWCHNTSALIVAHFKDRAWFLSSIKVQ